MRLLTVLESSGDAFRKSCRPATDKSRELMAVIEEGTVSCGYIATRQHRSKFLRNAEAGEH